MMKDAWRRLSPVYLFFCGLIIMGTFLFQEDLYIRLGQVVFFVLLAIATGRKFKLLPNLMVVTGITLVHLIAPHGRVLVSLGGWQITEGALVLGLYKGLMLIGLIYISRSFISPKLRLPGRGGAVLGLTFAYFERLTESKGAFSLKAPFESIDNLLIDLWTSEPPEIKTVSNKERSFNALSILPPVVAVVQVFLLFL